MSKAEKFIKEHTKNCSNQSGWNVQTATEEISYFQPWITPDQARKAVEIAMEEVLQEVKEKLLIMLNTSIDNKHFFEQLDDYIEELENKQLEMSKAEDLALEKYPPRSVLVVPARGGGYYADSHLREGFIEGYHQAEKDLELTWEDMMLIHKCIKDAMNYHLYKMMEGIEGQKIVYKEALKGFKDFKERK